MKRIFLTSLFIVAFYAQSGFGIDFPVSKSLPQPDMDVGRMDFVAFPTPVKNQSVATDNSTITDNTVVPFPKPKNPDGEIVPFPEPRQQENFLEATEFPKTIQDLSFTSRMELLADGYAPYEIVYENGVCVSGCAYPGITIQEDMAAVDEATEEMADLIAKEEQEEIEDDEEEEQQSPKKKKKKKKKDDQKPVATDWCHNGRSTRLPLRYPVDMSNFKYKIGSDFGFRGEAANSPNGSRFHPAIDINCPTGTPVYATADGVVEMVDTDDDPGGAGLYINIKHKHDLVTQYLHLSKSLVTPGQRVKACQKIAESGKSGKDINNNPYNGPHLDYRIRFKSDKNKYIDMLCPCRVSTKQDQSSNNKLKMSCAHSLFYAPYKFVEYSPTVDRVKRSNWRVEHDHCMKKNTDLLPDEVR